MSIYDWSSNPANNTSKPGIDWSEGMLPSAVNNSSRQMMADMAAWLAAPMFPTATSISVNGVTVMTVAGGAFTGNVGVGVTPTTTFDVKVTNTTRLHVSSALAHTGPRIYSGNALDNAFSPLEIQCDQLYFYNQLGTLIATLSNGGALNTLNAITQNGSQVWHAGNLTSSALNTIYGYTPISGINSGMVTGALGFTPANKAGDTFSGAFGRDANFTLDLVSSNPRITFDSGDYLSYDRTANKLTLFIGSTAVASIDASGNLKVAGNITAATTP